MEDEPFSTNVGGYTIGIEDDDDHRDDHNWWGMPYWKTKRGYCYQNGDTFQLWFYSICVQNNWSPIATWCRWCSMLNMLPWPWTKEIKLEEAWHRCPNCMGKPLCTRNLKHHVDIFKENGHHFLCCSILSSKWNPNPNHDHPQIRLAHDVQKGQKIDCRISISNRFHCSSWI